MSLTLCPRLGPRPPWGTPHTWAVEVGLQALLLPLPCGEREGAAVLWFSGLRLKALYLLMASFVRPVCTENSAKIKGLAVPSGSCRLLVGPPGMFGDSI